MTTTNNVGTHNLILTSFNKKGIYIFEYRKNFEKFEVKILGNESKPYIENISEVISLTNISLDNPIKIGLQIPEKIAVKLNNETTVLTLVESEAKKLTAWLNNLGLKYLLEKGSGFKELDEYLESALAN